MEQRLQTEKRFLELSLPQNAGNVILTEFRGHEGLSSLFCYSLSFLSSVDNLLSKIEPGTAATVTLNHPHAKAQYFHGHLETLVSVGKNYDGLTGYKAQLVPKLKLLHYNCYSQSFVNKNIIEILKQLFKQNNIYDYDVSGIKKFYSPYKYCVRYQESTYEFIARLLKKEGIYYYFKQEKNRHIFMMGDGIRPPHYYPLIMRYVNESEGDLPYLHEWQELYKMTYSLIQTKGNYPGLAAGMGVNITSEHKSSASYYITKITHHAFDHSQWGYYKTWDQQEQGEFGYYHQCQLYPQSIPFISEEKIRIPKISGVMLAKVHGPKGQPIYSHGEGLVKVQFYWDKNTKGHQSYSCFVPVQQNTAGDEWGCHFIPRVGNEVLVRFAVENPDKPSIDGSLYHGTHVHPFIIGAQSGIKTQSLRVNASSESHQLRFDDTIGHEEFYLRSQGDYFNKVKGSKQKKVLKDSKIVIQQGDYEAYMKAGAKITAAKNLHIKVGTSEIIMNSDGIQLHADRISCEA